MLQPRTLAAITSILFPHHFSAQIIQAVAIAAGKQISLVYNTGDMILETLGLLDGIIDIYMPDIKFIDEGAAVKYLRVKGYPKAVKTAIKEMHRQVGDLKLDEAAWLTGLLCGTW